MHQRPEGPTPRTAGRSQQLGHARLIHMSSLPVAISEDSKEKRVTSAAKAQAATGRRVFTGTPSSFIMGISLGLPANAANAEGGAPFPYLS
jgi:hypothetical protein